MTQLPNEFEITKPPTEEGSEPTYEQFNIPKPVRYDDPVVYLGLDVATKRDTCALVGVAPDDTFDSWTVWGYRIWQPPVDLVTQVEPVLDYVFNHSPVAGLWYDPYQAITLTQRLRANGHGHRLVEVNQQTRMTAAANTLHSTLTENRLALPDDVELRSHFSWASAKQTERGWRIIKLVQTKKIDVVVALAMALMGASQEHGHGTYPAWSSKLHVRTPHVFEGLAA
jgi:phage terminase large subunit-like protein